MDIRQEKEYIYGMMKDITSERRRLSEDYFELKKRLDKLDEIEMRGLDDISVDGYFNLHEQRQRKLSASNIRRELDVLDKKMNVPLNPKFHEQPQQERPAYQPSLEEVKREMEKSVVAIEKTPEPEPKIPKAIVEESKVKDKANKDANKTKKPKKRQSLDFNKIGALIRIVLKESGKPMELPEIQAEVQALMEIEISDSNFRQNLMYRANKEYKDIVRVGRGLYEFVSDEGDRKRKEVAGQHSKKLVKEDEKQEELELQEVT